MFGPLAAGPAATKRRMIVLMLLFSASARFQPGAPGVGDCQRDDRATPWLGAGAASGSG